MYHILTFLIDIVSFFARVAWWVGWTFVLLGNVQNAWINYQYFVKGDVSDRTKLAQMSKAACIYAIAGVILLVMNLVMLPFLESFLRWLRSF